jgi:hypothetical protein
VEFLSSWLNSKMSIKEVRRTKTSDLNPFVARVPSFHSNENESDLQESLSTNAQ